MADRTHLTSSQILELIGTLAAKAEERRCFLTRTRLVKFLYLVDVYWAQELRGEGTATGWPWRFIHFGPWCQDASDAINTAAQYGFIAARDFEGRRGDVDVQLFQAGPSANDSDVSAGMRRLPSYVSMRIGGDLSSFCANTSALLDYVYFHTGPMASANPSDTLDFSEERKPDVSALRPLAMKPLSKSKLLKARQAVQELASKGERQVARHEGPFDEHYVSFLDRFSEAETPIGISGRATIKG